MTIGERDRQYAGKWIRHRLLGPSFVVAALLVATGCVRMIFSTPPTSDTVGANLSHSPETMPIITNSIGMKLAYIPAGEFLMGSPESDDAASIDDMIHEMMLYGHEWPRHRVRITKPFRLGIYQVTRGEWTAVMGTTPWKGKKHAHRDGDRYPATYVSWQDATEFCRKLTEMERGAGRLEAGEAYRLPTEAEWEYACRAGTTTRYHFGDREDSLGEYAWFHGNTSDVNEPYLQEVGRKRPNAWDLYDMHGNVREWCSDWFGEKYYKKSPVADPQGPRKGSERVIRSGRSASRNGLFPESKRFFLGFRVVRSIGPGKRP